MKNLLLYLLLICASVATAQVPALNNTVKNNTLTSSRVGAALEVSEPYTASGTDTYTVSIGVTGLYSGSATYAAGDQFTIIFPNANATTTPTLNINSEGAITIVDNKGDAVSAGDVEGILKLSYDGTNFRIIGATGSGVGVTDGDKGDITVTGGTTWTIDNGAVTASEVTNTPAGNIAATNVQTALNELDTEKHTKFFTANRQTANYVLVLADAFKMVEMNVGTANTVTVPPNSSVAFSIGTVIKISQYGGGLTSLVAGSGVTIRAQAGHLDLGGQYADALLEKIDTDEWYLRNGNPAIVSSTYTPTLTNTTNVTASTAYVTGYLRIGTTVTVYGKVDIDATAASSTATVLGFSLPVTSNLANEQDLGGTAASNAAGAIAPVRIMGDATNDRASFVFLAQTTNVDSYNFTFSYQIK